MLRRRMLLILSVIGVLDLAVLSIASDVAAANLPAVLDKRKGLAWPVFITLTVLEIGLAVWTFRHGEQEATTVLSSTSAAEPFVISTTSTTAERDAQNRNRMIQRVRTFWVKGVLEQSLYHIARLELHLEARPAAVRQPWDLIIQKVDRAPYSLPSGTPISQVFDEMNQAVLILGDPGSGKTTTLLELAKELLDRAEQDSSHPIPVVFNLSSWAIERRPLVDWMVGELQERYVVPPAIGRTWIQNQQILPLLDGLDEVVAEHRIKCVDAINQFRLQYGLPIAVCSRIADYDALRAIGGVSAELRLEEAIFIEPLTKKEVARYLRNAGRPLLGVRTALRDDQTLWELLSTPLLLSIMALTYGNRSAAEVRRLGPAQERRERLFAAYSHSMFERRGVNSRFRRRESVRWLKWLGRTLSANRQTLLRLEWMQPGWLPGRKERWAVTQGVALVVGCAAMILVGLAAWVSFRQIIPSPFEWGSAAVLGLVAGVSCGLATYDREIRPAEGLDWSWSTIRDWLVEGITAGLERGVVLGLLFGVLAILVGSTVGLPGLGTGIRSGIIGMGVSLLLALAISLNIGITGGLLRWLTVQRGESDILPKEDAPSATWNVLVGGLASALFLGLSYAITLGVIFGFFDRQNIGTRAGSILGGTLGLVVVLRTGGGAYLQHLALRSVLYLRDYAPWRYTEFLDNATERLFLRKVGRGYIFVHRLLLEHFATSDKPDEFEEHKVASARSRDRR
jgi:DNA polymerase III delta prime subunit